MSRCSDTDIQDSHTYSNPGTFSILVTAHDDDGNSAQAMTSVIVRPSGTGIVPPPDGSGGGGNGSAGPVTNLVPAQRTVLPLAEGQIAPATGGLELTQALDFDQSPGTSVGRGQPALDAVGQYARPAGHPQERDGL